jgi:hypothetical protein
MERLLAVALELLAALCAAIGIVLRQRATCAVPAERGPAPRRPQPPTGAGLAMVAATVALGRSSATPDQ